MNLRPDGSLLIETPLSMSRLPDAALSAEAADTARLVRLTLGGDTAAFEQIILRYEARVMAMATRLLGGRQDAADVAQEVFLRAYKYLHRVDLDKPLEPWLFRIAVNVCRDTARRREQRRSTFVEDDGVETIDRAEDALTGLERKQERVLLKRALDRLPEKERLAIVLRDIEGLSTAEVASILRSSESTVRSQVCRGRLRLKAAIQRVIGGQP